MIKNYFFVPANKTRFLEKIPTLTDIDYCVFDLEDSVLSSDIQNAFELLSNFKMKNTDWLRIPLIKSEIKAITLKSMQIGLNNYVIPKFNGFDELRKIIQAIQSVNSKAKFILLIENAKSYIELERILVEFNECIHGVSLGIHDFSFSTGLKNDFVFLRNIRMKLMLLAKAYSVEPIDIVSTNLNNEEDLRDEVLDGLKTGYRSKFLIHPFQLAALKAVPYYEKEEIDSYKKILKYYFDYIDGKEALFTYNGRIYEKMHIEEIKKIVKWGDEFYESTR